MFLNEKMLSYTNSMQQDFPKTKEFPFHNPRQTHSSNTTKSSHPKAIEIQNVACECVAPSILKLGRRSRIAKKKLKKILI
jgi:hypothetical protein